MQIHELPTISGSPSGGYFATDNGTQTTKIDYTALAQAIIEQYNASTLAGTAQSVKSALDGLNSNAYTLSLGTAIPSGADLTSYTTPGTFYISSNSIASSLNALPESTAGRFMVETEGTTGTVRQIYKPYNSTLEYVRRISGATVTTWEKQPTRAEVDALNSKNAGTTYTSVENLYNYGIDTPGFKLATITSAVASSLTKGVITSASRIFLCRADNTTVDALLFSLASGKIYLSRIANGVAVKAYSASVTEISLS